MSFTPFHGVADELRALADRVAELGDQVHTGSYTVGAPPEEAEGQAREATPAEQASAGGVPEEPADSDPTTPSKTGDAELRAKTSESAQQTTGGRASSTSGSAG